MSHVPRIIVLVVTVSLFAAAVDAGPPLSGTYKSSAGQVLAGRFAESFAVPNDFMVAGNVMNAGSWDGASLGAQYMITCATQATTPTLVFDGVNSATGSGTQIWSKTYTGGTFFLNGTGEAWDGGDPVYTGTIDTYAERVTVIFFAFNRIAATSNVEGSGRFDGFSTSCINWIGNGADLSGPKPGGYPDYLNPSTCAGTRMFGRFGSRTALTVNITPCVLPVEDASWGRIKALYN